MVYLDAHIRQRSSQNVSSRIPYSRKVDDVIWHDTDNSQKSRVKANKSDILFPLIFALAFAPTLNILFISSHKVFHLNFGYSYVRMCRNRHILELRYMKRGMKKLSELAVINIFRIKYIFDEVEPENFKIGDQ